MNDDIDHRLAAARQRFEAGRLDDAAQLLQGILSDDPDHSDALEGLGYIAAKQGEHALAADYVIRAARPTSRSAQQLHLAAQICQSAGRHADAAALFERCIAQWPSHAPSLHGAAMSLVQLGEHQRALQLLTRVTESHPRLAEAHYNRGTLLGVMERYDEEIAAYRRAIGLDPKFVRAYVNLGVALRDLHRFDEALAQFKIALSTNPNDAGARTNRAQTNLLLGEFEHGWREYEWRWRDGTASHGFPGATLWTGAQPISGKTVLVHHEQGFGDTLQFVRFIDRLSAAGAHVVLRVPDALMPLLQDYPGATLVISETVQAPPFDYHIPALSLPFALKVRASDLAVCSPYLRADAAIVAQWDDLFAHSTAQPRVGVVWSGSRGHVNDRNRSIPLGQLAPLFDAAGNFVSLQKDVRDDDRSCLVELTQRTTLREVSGRLATFADTAALIQQLDLVISVDTAVAHLAGALGKPVWIALPFTPDWRWQLNRSDSPWYPGARLFRQTTRGDWTDVVTALRRELDAWPRA
jgi:tetratricopeptide (TPR) repeat protein